MPRGPCAPPLAMGQPSTSRGGSAPRHELPELPVRLVGHHVERAVRTLAHVADALAAVGEEVFFTYDPVVLEDQSHKSRAAEAADEEAAAPCGEEVSGIELRARGRDDGIPVVDRAHEPLAVGDRAVDRSARVLEAEAHQRPAIVLSLLDEVELVAAARAVL